MLNKLAFVISPIVATMIILSGCGQATKADKTASPSPAQVTAGAVVVEVSPAAWASFQKAHPEDARRARLSPWGSYVITYYVMMDADYVQALKLRAETALIDARVAAQRNQTIAALVRRVEVELVAEMRALDAEIARMEQGQARVYAESMKIERLNAGVATPENIRAVDYMLGLANAERSELAKIRVPALSTGEFESRGAWRVEVTADGERIFRKNETQAFAGGNALQFLAFLNDTRQNAASGGKAHAALMQITELVAKIGVEWNAEIEEQQEALHAKKMTSLDKLIGLIEALEGIEAN